MPRHHPESVDAPESDDVHPGGRALTERLRAAATGHDKLHPTVDQNRVIDRIRTDAATSS